MAWNPLTDAEIQVGKPVKKTLWQKLKDSLEYLYGQLAPSSINSAIPNGSFEVDSDSDGIPDRWTRNLFPGGSGSFETGSPAEGAKAWKFVHPGGVGNGGGYLDSDYVEISQLKTYVLGYTTWASAAGMRNLVQVLYYNASKVYLSAATLYDSQANPGAATAYLSQHTPPATARFIKVRLIGGENSVNVAGTAYFDNITHEAALRTNAILDNAVTTPKIADSNVTVSKLRRAQGSFSYTGTWGVWEFSADVHQYAFASPSLTVQTTVTVSYVKSLGYMFGANSGTYRKWLFYMDHPNNASQSTFVWDYLY
ncbi:MAG: hypothetical protein AB1805_07630 [Nitrospirota bacterium]